MKNLEKKIELISSEQCIDLRLRILRPGQPIELCHYPEDNFKSTFHIGVFVNDVIICNGTFIKNSCHLFSDYQNQYRLRGMATEKMHQGQGNGQLLLQNAEQILKSQSCELLWCNARETAFQFYKKCGFEFCGDLFNIPLIGPHQVMYKKL